MAAQARTPRSHVLGCSSMLHFVRSLVGRKGSSKSANKHLTRSQPSSSQEQGVVGSPGMGHQGDPGRKEPQPRVPSVASSSGKREPQPGVPSVASSSGKREPQPGVHSVASSSGKREPQPRVHSVASSSGKREPQPRVSSVASSSGKREPQPRVLSAASSSGKREPQPRVFSAASSNPRLNAFGQGTGDSGSQTLTSKDVPKLRAQGVEGTSVPTRGAWEVLEYLPEKKEEEEPAGEVSGASDRDHCGQALEAEQQWVPGTLALTSGAFIKEEEDEHCLIDFGDLKLSSCKVGSTPWNYLLGLYKQLQKSAMAKAQRPTTPPLALEDVLPHEEKGEREEAVDESNLKWCAPRASADQSPLQKRFRSTDTVGFVESELKKILAVQREARLWKVGNPEGRELLTQPDITLEEAGMVNGQHLLLEEIDEMGNWPPPE
ncbi:gametogenetin-binding protein 1-like isoform X2 [Mastomys coucha]|uniref:gametogenetin-binding protein 1-like isoform X2 n=1 Tax=Mastomys coucha TaxID=35658 RepID=UPI0012625CA7|nr:gametogenetin-binding protein 1-like isoform X2 [Mastomys coucha]